MLLGVLALTLVYLVGSIPFGLIVGKLRGVDVRRLGSGNIGATNVSRALGLRWAALVLFLDAAKGGLAVLAMGMLFSDHPAQDRWIALAMISAVSGHIYPIFLSFNGGKGVATTLGVTLVGCPPAALVGVAGYGLGLLLTRTSAVGSLAGVGLALLWLWLGPAPRAIAIAFTAISALILLHHRDNIRSLADRKK